MKLPISFPSSAMQVSEQDLPAVSDAARGRRAGQAGGVWVFGNRRECAAGHGRWGWHCDAGARTRYSRSKAATTVLEVPFPVRVGAGMGQKFAVACRCAQEVREFQYDPASGLTLAGWPEWVVVAKVRARFPHHHGGGRSQPRTVVTITQRCPAAGLRATRPSAVH